MATKRTPGSRPGLVRCDHCGEEYSESYRRCPFCADFDADAKYETRPTHAATYGTARTASSRSSTATRQASSRATSSRSTTSRGGKRVAQSNRRGGGYKKISAGKIIAWLLSLIVIVAAIWILVTQVGPMFGKDKDKDTDKDVKDPSTSQTTPDPDTSPAVSDPVGSDEPDAQPSPSTQVPSTDTAVGFTLSSSDFSFTDAYPAPITLKVTFSPPGTTAAIIWSSSDPSIASVDANGVVSHGSVRGTATITAAMANGVQQTCIVRNQVTSGAAYEPEDPPAQTSYALNKVDFTFYTLGESTKLKVSGYTGTISWSSSDSSLIKVDPDGTVTAVGTGKANCVITATLDDGTKLQADARINIS